MDHNTIVNLGSEVSPSTHTGKLNPLPGDAPIHPGYTTYRAAGGEEFLIPDRYELVNRPNKHSSLVDGVVCSAKDTLTGQLVDVKKLPGCFDRPRRAILAVRELNAMATLRYFPKVCTLLDIMIPPPDADGVVHDLYFAREFVDGDLESLYNRVKPTDPPVLTQQIIQYISKQVVQGVSAMHRAGILHRDLKPMNCLVRTADVKVRVANFELARDEDTDMTSYVVTRYYRAPEVMFAYQGLRDPDTPKPKFCGGLDMWAVGCIVAEMLGNGKVLITGDSYFNQVERTFQLIGTPSPEQLHHTPSEVQAWVQTLPVYPSKLGELAMLLPPPPDATAEDLELHAHAIDFVTRCLVFDPTARITAADALKHPYLNDGCESEDEPSEEMSDPPRPLPSDIRLETVDDCRAAVNSILHFIRTIPSSRGSRAPMAVDEASAEAPAVAAVTDVVSTVE